MPEIPKKIDEYMNNILVLDRFRDLMKYIASFIFSLQFSYVELSLFKMP